ncbi:2-isopropylmalate synthase [Nocardioides zeae]|uniref:2-isopropylmalate synthase n=2 Tax=Nocardioides zeae TaxID=1457234 RepID=A0ACC6IKF9_9ACTN|nr:citramalate synthase [Nocardioides zeae]MDQ1105009.1 2-isopropylmalate synthase [Nocardioides zeae]MDR6175277.1 2-isopropylmalate synthase [Nocardioides zeae]MDR6211231.1 2-isopropylmalate synthase [Nocardioides zeae]
MSIAEQPLDLQGAFHVYDTTLRDGAQQEGLNLSVGDKLAIARLIDELGVGYVEGGWPGANPKDTEFFRRARTELDLKHARLAAFGSTRRAGVAAADDPLVAALRDSGAGTACLVAKSHDRHVELALRTTLAENLAMVRDTVAHLRGEGLEVFVDAEHFFDGYRRNRSYALDVLGAAFEAGAELVALCDTNGGMLPPWVGEIVADVVATTGGRVGIHAHNDTGCAVANSVAAVQAGATHVQGCINGYGERTGNADLVAVVAALELKLERPVLPPGALAEATRIAHAVAEVTNVPPASRQPYVGTSAFAHKAGLHASAIKVDPDLYQHMDPAGVGNDMRLLVSDMAGRASIELKGRELGYDLSVDSPEGKELVTRITERVKILESRGYTFEAADASFELMLVEEVSGRRPAYVDVESWRVITESRAGGEALSEATVKLHADGTRIVVTGEGNGPVNALDQALRTAMGQAYPEVGRFRLIDYKVRILDQGLGTDAITRVLIETSDGESSWVTVGVGANVVEASWGALLDGVTFGLHRGGVRPVG